VINPLAASVPEGGDGGDVARPMQTPLEAHSSYRGKDWSPQRLVFHQNLESFADRVGLIVGLQSNGKMSQESAYTEIRKIWKELKNSKDELLNDTGDSAN
jgi:hypothetical protein